MHLLVMAKSPVAGRVKTRLCPPCTPAEAASLAEAALADTLAAVAAVDVDRRVVALDGEAGPWLPPGFTVIPQRGGAFDQRLAAAWDDSGGPGLQIGMDTPQVTPPLLEDALARLDTPGTQAVLGHAADGGWWAIGLRRPDPAAFLGVPMSTAATGTAQAQRLDDLGLSVELLPVLRDVDVMADALEVAAGAPHTAFAARFGALVAAVNRRLAAA